MRKTLRTTIDGHTYESAQLGAVEGRKLYLRFIKLLATFAPLLASLRTMLKDAKKSDGEVSLESLIGSIDNDTFMKVLSEASAHLDPEEFEVCWEAYGAYCYFVFPGGRQNLRECFDEHFAGRYGAMTKLFLELTKLNFGGFLAEVGSGAGREAPTSSP